MQEPQQDPFAVWNFVVQVIVAIGTLGAVFAAIWGDWLRSKFASPKLSIELRSSKGVLGQGREGQPAIYYHLHIVNSRAWATARKCRVLLREVNSKGPNQEFYTIPMPVPISFFWAPRRSTPLEVDVLHEQTLDFGFVAEKDLVFVPQLTVMLDSFEGRVRANEVKRFILEPLADAYRAPKSYIFEVAWDGQWSADLEKMSRHLTIREILPNTA
jgi:hypothetical protein